MLARIISFALLLSIVSAGFFSSSGPGNYSLLCDETKEYRCPCPKDDTTNVLDCSSRKLTELPVDIKFPSYVMKVFFSKNQLTKVPNNVFSEGIRVEFLDLSHNHIDLLSSDTFANLNDLKTLDLSHNAIWSLSVDTFSGLENLENLNLAYNKISDFFPDVFKPCKNLKELSLRFNPISFVSQHMFSNLPGLQVLDLSSCGLANLRDKPFEENPLLTELKLSANSFSDVPTEGLNSARNLKQLDLSENPITQIRSKAFDGLSELEILIISHMRKLVCLNPHSLAGLNKLKELVLTDNTNLSKISESSFKKEPPVKTDDSSKAESDDDDDNANKHPSLEKLLLRHNNLLSLPEGLVDWSKLKEVDLRENPWQCDCHLSWVATKVASDSAKNAATCKTPSRLAGRSFSSLGETDYTCNYLSSDATVALSVMVVVAFVLALGGVSYLMYKRSLISCGKKNDQPRYARVTSDKEKVDLEWDHTGEPESRA